MTLDQIKCTDCGLSPPTHYAIREIMLCPGCRQQRINHAKFNLQQELDQAIIAPDTFKIFAVTEYEQDTQPTLELLGEERTLTDAYRLQEHFSRRLPPHMYCEIVYPAWFITLEAKLNALQDPPPPY